MVVEPKRLMGMEVDAFVHPDTQKAYCPEEISALILGKLKTSAEEFWGDDVKAAVISVPAYFENAGREATRKAAELARLEVLGIRSEPVAAAIAYRHQHPDMADGKYGVFDLGGGTFDICIIEIKGDEIQTITVDGYRILGGTDATRSLEEWILENFRSQHKIEFDPNEVGDAAFLQDIREKAERAKLELSKLDATTLHIMAKGVQLTDHLRDFHNAMHAKNDGAEHVMATFHRVQKTIETCGFQFWSDISASRVQAFLAERRNGEDTVSPRTANAYLVAFKSFCAWCVRDGRALESPVVHLRKVNEKIDIRCRRRALSRDELSRLIQAASGGAQWRGMPGQERALLYQLAAETGLRWSELRSLKRKSLALDTDPSTVTVEAAYTKNKREDVLPLRSVTAGTLRHFLDLRPEGPSLPVFPNMPHGRVGAKMIRADLKAARETWLSEVKNDSEEHKERTRKTFLSYEDDAGRVADFHALRHTFITALAQAGVHPKRAQDLARHGDINLTLSKYTHTVLEDRAEAVESLPDISTPSHPEQLQATGTDDQSVLAVCLDRQSRFRPIEADQSRRLEGGKTGVADKDKSLGNTGKNLRSQGSHDWSGRGDLNSRPLDPQSHTELSQGTLGQELMQAPDRDLVACLDTIRKLLPDLAPVANLWNHLSSPMKKGILAMVQAATEPTGHDQPECHDSPEPKQ